MRLGDSLATDIDTIAASFTAITTALIYIPGNPPYYQATIVIIAKLYSNSMVAAVNSRMKVVSNSPSGFPPSWNESFRPTESLQSTHDIEFIRDESFYTMEDAV